MVERQYKIKSYYIIEMALGRKERVPPVPFLSVEENSGHISCPESTIGKRYSDLMKPNQYADASHYYVK